MKKPGATYSRLSDTRKKNEPTLDFQNRKNREYLESRGYFVAPDAVYQEPEGHRSGRFIEQRPAMQKLFADLSRYANGAVAFYEFTRFTRSVEFMFQFIREADRHRVKLYDVYFNQQLTLDNLNDFLLMTIRAMSAEMESREGSRRLKSAYQRARENNWVHHRRAPFGLKVVGSLAARHFEPSPDLKIVIEFLKCVASGKSMDDAALEMRTRKFKYRTFDGSQIFFETYHGRFIVSHADYYRAFIDSKLIDAAVRRVHERRGKFGNAKPKKHKPQILGFGLLRCAECGHTFLATVGYSRTTPRVFGHYRHVHSYVCGNLRRVTAWKIEPQVFDVLDAFAQKQLEQPNRLDQASERQKREKQNQADVTKRRAELQQKLKDAKARMFDNLQLADEYAELKQQIEKELADLTKEDKPTAQLSPAQVKQLIAQHGYWREMAEREPLAFNVMLRDLFYQITIDRENVLRFYPHAALCDYFRGIKNCVLEGQSREKGQGDKIA